MSFETSRTIGRVSMLVLLIGVIVSPIFAFSSIFLRAAPPVGLIFTIIIGVLSFVGNILFLVAMNGFANFYQTPKIFRNALYAFLSAIIGGIALTLSFFGLIISWIPPSYTPPGQAYGPPLSSTVLPFLAAIAIVWIGLFIIVLVQSIFYRSSLIALAEKSGENNFKTAGLLMLIGGALTIVFIGVFLFLVGWLFTAMGFFSMKPQPVKQNSTMMQPNVTTESFKRTCSNCGALNTEAAIYCSRCGNKL
jgi:uncharacterized membrane protein